MEEIRFWSAQGPYGYMSNFAPYAIVDALGKKWPTSEHYFQAMKFEGTDPAYQEEIRAIRHPKEAAQLGRDKNKPLRPDWESIKEQVMYDALLFKFTQHTSIRDRLKQTGSAAIFENSPYDYYWGTGSDGTGKNRLGVLLMKLRGSL